MIILKQESNYPYKPIEKTPKQELLSTYSTLKGNAPVIYSSNVGGLSSKTSINAKGVASWTKAHERINVI